MRRTFFKLCRIIYQTFVTGPLTWSYLTCIYIIGLLIITGGHFAIGFHWIHRLMCTEDTQEHFFTLDGPITYVSTRSLSRGQRIILCTSFLYPQSFPSILITHFPSESLTIIHHGPSPSPQHYIVPSHSWILKPLCISNLAAPSAHHPSLKTLQESQSPS
jgi:hypothetical protein